MLSKTWRKQPKCRTRTSCCSAEFAGRMEALITGRKCCCAAVLQKTGPKQLALKCMTVNFDSGSATTSQAFAPPYSELLGWLCAILLDLVPVRYQVDTLCSLFLHPHPALCCLHRRTTSARSQGRLKTSRRKTQRGSEWWSSPRARMTPWQPLVGPLFAFRFVLFLFPYFCK